MPTQPARPIIDPTERGAPDFTQPSIGAFGSNQPPNINPNQGQTDYWNQFNPGVGYRNGTPTEQFLIDNAGSVGSAAGSVFGAGLGLPGLGTVGRFAAPWAVNEYFERHPELALNNPAPRRPPSELGTALDEITSRSSGVYGDEQSSPVTRNNPYSGGVGANTYGRQGIGTGAWISGSGSSGLTLGNNGRVRTRNGKKPHEEKKIN